LFGGTFLIRIAITFIYGVHCGSYLDGISILLNSMETFPGL